MIYFAKSVLASGSQPTVQEHLEKVSSLASRFGEDLSMKEEAALAGLFHDFGKYSLQFQRVLSGDAFHVDHALPGAVFLSKCWKRNGIIHKRGKHIIEAIAGHHDGLRNFMWIASETPAPGKISAITGNEEYLTAQEAFLTDFPAFRFSVIPDQHISPKEKIASMLYTRMLFSCLVDADYCISASDENENYIEHTTNEHFDPKALLERLNVYRNTIRACSKANSMLNSVRDAFYIQCGNSGEQNEEGLFTLTGPTGIGKTLALMHFSLRHCIKWNKKRIIVVLPFLSLTEQTVKEYSNIVDTILEDTSQVEWSDQAKEYSARWSTPIIVTTSVKFFESLFANQPTSCRKLHHIANSVILFDEAQSLPNELLHCTLQTVDELCRRYHVTMVFSTATQPDYRTILSQWHPREIYPDNAPLFKKLKRVNVHWQLKENTPLYSVAQEMSKRNSVCTIVNLRKHARELFESLIALSSEDDCFFLTTDLCAEHRSQQIQTIKERLIAGLPCRVVATQCIEAGVDMDFDVMYRALAPLEAIIQAAGRCNRNGRLLQGGEVIVFTPASKGKLYPDNWYMQGAGVVAQMHAENGEIDISDPSVIQIYYQHLFRNQKDKQELTEAIEEQDYVRTSKEYCLIESKGVQVIVPYGQTAQNYEQIRNQLLVKGITSKQMREFAPYTVSCALPQDLINSFAESIPLVSRNKFKKADISSGYYVLRPQFQQNYSLHMGLQPLGSTVNQFLL